MQDEYHLESPLMSALLKFRTRSLILGLLLAAAGCQEGTESSLQTAGPQAGGFASVRLPDVGLGAVRTAGGAAFREHFRVDPAASSDSVLVAKPSDVEGRAEEESARVRDVLAVSRNRRRQLAELHMTQEGRDVQVRCRVIIQRLDTAERAAFAAERGDDRPGHTPIDRSGPDSPMQREEWVNVGRDRQLERTILMDIQQRLTGVASRPVRE